MEEWLLVGADETSARRVFLGVGMGAGDDSEKALNTGRGVEGCMGLQGEAHLLVVVWVAVVRVVAVSVVVVVDKVGTTHMVMTTHMVVRPRTAGTSRGR